MAYLIGAVSRYLCRIQYLLSNSLKTKSKVLKYIFSFKSILMRVPICAKFVNTKNTWIFHISCDVYRMGFLEAAQQWEKELSTYYLVSSSCCEITLLICSIFDHNI